MSTEIELDQTMLNIVLKGNTRCQFQIGDHVKKISIDDQDDLHPIGCLGKIIGSLHHQFLGDMYLVEWVTGKVSFCAGIKLEKVSDEL